MKAKKKVKLGKQVSLMEMKIELYGFVLIVVVHFVDCNESIFEHHLTLVYLVYHGEWNCTFQCEYK